MSIGFGRKCDDLTKSGEGASEQGLRREREVRRSGHSFQKAHSKTCGCEGKRAQVVLGGDLGIRGVLFCFVFF